MFSASRSRLQPGSMTELLFVALPLVLSSGSLSLMNVADRMMLAQYSTESLAAALPASMLHWTLMSIPVGIASYLNSFVAQYEGAKQTDRVAAITMQGIYFAAFSGIVVIALIPFARVIFAWAGHAESVQALENAYFSVLCFGSLPIILSSALSSFYSGRGDTVTVLYVNVAAVLVNVVVDYLLIFGVGPFPELGIRGAAVATVTANVVGVTIFATLMWRSRAAAAYPFRAERRFDWMLTRRLIRFGLPMGLQYFSDIAAFTIFILILGKSGKIELAATSLAFNLESICFIPLMGLGTAVATLVGKRIGEGQPRMAIRTTWVAFAVSGTMMLLAAFCYLAFPEMLIYPFLARTAPAELESIQSLTIELLKFVAVFTFFDGMAIVFGSAIRGAGDTRFSLIANVVCCWSIMVLPTLIAWQILDDFLYVGWTACTTFVIVIGITFLLRFCAGKWQSMSLIEPQPGVAIPTSAIFESEAVPPQPEKVGAATANDGERGGLD